MVHGNSGINRELDKIDREPALIVEIIKLILPNNEDNPAKCNENINKSTNPLLYKTKGT